MSQVLRKEISSDAIINVMQLLVSSRNLHIVGCSLSLMSVSQSCNGWTVDWWLL